MKPRAAFRADAVERAKDAVRLDLQWVQVIVRRKRAPRGERVQLWPGGPKGNVIGQIGNGDWMIDVLAVDIIKHAAGAG